MRSVPAVVLAQRASATMHDDARFPGRLLLRLKTWMRVHLVFPFHASVSPIVEMQYPKVLVEMKNLWVNLGTDRLLAAPELGEELRFAPKIVLHYLYASIFHRYEEFPALV